MIAFFVYYYQFWPKFGWKLYLVPLVILFYSNLPDLDHYMGKLRKKTLTIIFSSMILSSIIFLFVNIGIFIVLLIITGFLGLGLLQVRHRGPLHTYWFIIIASSPLLLLHWYIFLIGLISSASHIFVDRAYSRFKRRIRAKFGQQNQTRNYNFNFKW